MHNNNMQDENQDLCLDNQMCFPLYACARKIINTYAPILKNLDLTYTQYVTMLVMWEEPDIAIKTLCQRLYLDSGTLTPVIKKLCAQGLLEKYRNKTDERIVNVKLTEKGQALKEEAKKIPEMMRCAIFCDDKNFTKEDALALRKLLKKLLKVP